MNSITVTTDNDVCTFKADSWYVSDDKDLTVLNGNKAVAVYAPGQWQYVHEAAAVIDDQTTPDQS